MRLIFVSHSLPPADRPLASIGGMQRVALELHSALSESDRVDYEAVMLRASWRSVHVRVVPFLIRTFFRLRREATSGNVDVILFSSMVTASLAVPLRKIFRARGITAAAIVHGQDVTKPVRIYQRWVPRVFSALDVVMPVSSATARACIERGLPPEKVRVVHNGVDVTRFDSLGTRRGGNGPGDGEFDGLPSLSADALLMCSVGRQVLRKGFAWFIDNVMPKLPDHIHYWLAGDGPESERIDQAIQQKDLGHRVKRLGRVTEQQLLALYDRADLFIMPNIPVPGDMEGFGIVMLEAGMMGVPTIAARLEGIREVITEGRNGYFVETRDQDGFASRILELDRDRDRLSELSSTTHRHVRQTFGWQAVASSYLDELEEACG